MRNIIFIFVALGVTLAVGFMSEIRAFDQSYPHTRFTHKKIVEQFIESLETGSAIPLEKVSNHPSCRDQVQRDVENISISAHPVNLGLFDVPLKVKSYEFSVTETNHEDEDSTTLRITTEEREKLLFFLWAEVKGFPGKQYLCGISRVPG